MTAIYVLCALTGALSIGIVWLENKGYAALKYVLKAVASLCFVLTGALAMGQASFFQNWYIYVIAGLVLGLMGDVFLSSGNIVPQGKTLDLLNLSGLLFFLFGHIVYIVWMLGLTEGFNYWLLFIVAALPIIIIVLNKTGVMKFGKATLPVVLYSVVIGVMLAAAVNAYLNFSEYTIGKLILSGGVLFCVSDSILAYQNFGGKPSNALKYIYMPAYYAAQLIFAMSIVF